MSAAILLILEYFQSCFIIFTLPEEEHGTNWKHKRNRTKRELASIHCYSTTLALGTCRLSGAVLRVIPQLSRPHITDVER